MIRDGIVVDDTVEVYERIVYDPPVPYDDAVRGLPEGAYALQTDAGGELVAVVWTCRRVNRADVPEGWGEGLGL